MKLSHEYAGTVKRQNVWKRTLVSHKVNVPFFYRLSQWDKNCSCFEVYFWSYCAKIVSKFLEIMSDKTLTRIDNPAPSEISDLLNHNTVTSVDQIIWSFNTISFSLVTRTEVIVSSLDHPIHACWYDSIFKWRLHCTSVKDLSLFLCQAILHYITLTFQLLLRSIIFRFERMRKKNMYTLIRQ